MKKYLKISLLLLFVCVACNDSNENKEVFDDIISKETIFGKWKLTETSFSIGGPEQITRDVEDGTEYVFFEDGSFTSTRYDECSRGEYRINLEENELIVKYTCTDFTPNIVDENGEFVYYIGFKDSNSFTLSPRTVICTEGCSSLYTRQ